MLYSLRSFASERAFPFRSSLCASAGGADGKAASCAFIAEIVSVGCALRVKVAAGLRDLNTSAREAVSQKTFQSVVQPVNAIILTGRRTLHEVGFASGGRWHRNLQREHVSWTGAKS